MNGCVLNLRKFVEEKIEIENVLKDEVTNLKACIKSHETNEYRLQSQLTELNKKYTIVHGEYTELKKSYLGRYNELMAENTKLRSTIASLSLGTGLNTEDVSLREKNKLEKENLKLQKTVNSVNDVNRRLSNQVSDLENRKMTLEQSIRLFKEKNKIAE